MKRLTLGLLVIPILFNLICLYPETQIERYPLNDAVFHFAASQRLAETGSLRAWLPMSMGYPLWSVYQPGAHVGTALAFRALWWIDPHAVYAWLTYLLLSFMPLGFYALARSLGLSQMGAVAAAALSITPSSTGPFSRADVGYASYVWRSWGLYAQLWGVCVGLPAAALVLRSIHTGKHLIWAGLALSAAIMCHFVVGWILVVSLLALLTFERPLPWKRAMWVFGVASPIPALFMLQVWMNQAWINNGHYAETWRTDSFGFMAITAALVNGTLFDLGRFPLLTLLILVGGIIAWYHSRHIAILALGWLAVFFGPATWGRLLEVVGLPGGLQAHRSQMGFEIFAILLAAITIDYTTSRIPSRWALTGIAGFVLLLIPLYSERSVYLKGNAMLGEANAKGYRAEAQDLQSLVAYFKQLTSTQTGRIEAGRKRGWGDNFEVGTAPLSTYLIAEGLPCTGFPFHVLSSAADSAFLLQQFRRYDLQLFGVKWLVAPVGVPVPANVTVRDQIGRWMIYNVPGGGMFDVVQVPYRWTGTKDNVFYANEFWMTNPLRWYGQYVETALDGRTGDLKMGDTWPAPKGKPPYGKVLSEWRQGDRYKARVQASVPAYVRVSLAYHPWLRARVDGQTTPVLMVTPGFVAFAVPEGTHDVEVF